MCNQKAKASAHYLVTKLGDIYQLVKDEDSSWHAGAVSKPNWKLYDGSNPNYYTIGIEHEALPGERLTEMQYQATLWLHKQLIAKHGIPIDEGHIIGHYRIDSVNRPNCPGPGFPWQRLFNDLKGSEEVPEWKQKIMDRAHSLGLIDKSLHKPDETASKWFVLAVILNLYDKLKGDK
jgi:N-acetyl-anhydromuramyl-L-alanine amidase AmpD